MDICKFRDGLPGRFLEWGTPLCRPVASYSHVSDVLRMAMDNKLDILNFAVQCLDPGEIYLEAGIFRGCSLVSALYGTSGVGVGIDNWSQFQYPDDNRNATMALIDKHGLRDRVSVFDGDTKRVLAQCSVDPVGVYHYDADHRWFETYMCLDLSLSHLADRALVVVDDSDWVSVRRGINTFIAVREEEMDYRVSVLYDFHRHVDNDPAWGNGQWLAGVERIRGRD